MITRRTLLSGVACVAAIPAGASRPMPSLAEMVADAKAGDVITLAPGVHDHDDVVRIRKDLAIKGPREAIVRAELALGVCAGTEAAAGAALEIVGSKAILSGSHWYRFGTTLYGAAVARDGFLQVGAGLYTTLQFPTPSILDQTAARKWVAPGCIG